MSITLELSNTDTILAKVPSGSPSPRFPDGCYTVEISPTEAGLSALLRILREQKRLGGAMPKIGTPAAPVQSIIEAWEREHTVQRYDASGHKECKSLEDLGL